MCTFTNIYSVIIYKIYLWNILCHLKIISMGFFSEPAHWHNQNSFFQQINGFTNHCSGKNQNGLLFQDSNGFNHHNNCKFQNGFLQIENGQIKNYDNGFLPQMNVQNNNSICESSSTIEHYSSVSQEQGYDSLLMESFSNQYDGSWSGTDRLILSCPSIILVENMPYLF